MDQTSIIASKHLGKTSDGTLSKPYSTPTNIDPSLLVAIPRSLNRTAYRIDNPLPFCGYDYWNAYEFSCLGNNGLPHTGVIRWAVNASSSHLLESKSVKLYLNSFNMVPMGQTKQEITTNVIDRIKNDFSAQPGLNNMLDVAIHWSEHNNTSSAFKDEFVTVETLDAIEKTRFEHHKENPSLLDVISQVSLSPTRYHSSCLRSNCRVTNQPDWGDVYVSINGKHTITPESFCQYIVSMRDENHFHEEICECIYMRLKTILNPDELYVACFYTRRGGIDINPIRASHRHLIKQHKIADVTVQTKRTHRQ
jgi:7-cyano-7-deazaguanine reductase